MKTLKWEKPVDVGEKWKKMRREHGPGDEISRNLRIQKLGRNTDNGKKPLRSTQGKEEMAGGNEEKLCMKHNGETNGKEFRQEIMSGEKWKM